jgi:signal transduction histidine kinase
MAGVILLLLLLTWLLQRSSGTMSPAYEEALQAFDDFALAEASLQRDMLQARAGLLRNYDPLSRSIEGMERAAERILSSAQLEAIETGPAERLAALVAMQEELTERFKSDNAILQNSLAYVALLSTSPDFVNKNTQLVPEIGALAAAILKRTHDASAESVTALRQRLREFEDRAVQRDSEETKAFLAHARLLHDLIPAVDERVKTILAAPSKQILGETHDLFTQRRANVESVAQLFRLWLYAASLLLLLLLGGFVLRLRERALERQRRAALEQVIARNSTRLISCPPGETGAWLKQVLGEFGAAIGVERGYVVIGETPIRVIAWSADGIAYPDGWPVQALTISSQLSADGPGILRIADVDTLPAGDAKNALVAAKVRGWACVPLILPGEVRGIMGFDAFQPAWERLFPMGMMRLAGDAVANAIEREYLERDRAELSTRFERSRRMQMIGSLTSGIAHNFNNIIGAILGYAEMAAPRHSPGTRSAQDIDEIRQAAERGRDLIGHILIFGRRGDAPVQRVQICSLLREAASLLRVSLPKGIELIINEVPPDLAVAGEPAQLQQIVLNLCSNAAQAIVGSGTIRVTAEEQEVTATLTLSHGELSPGRYICLAVSDTGRGFDQTVARRLFEPFFTTRRSGTGLGLATVHEIVQDHHGAMNVKSKPGHGSRFEAWLPFAAVKTVPAVQAAPQYGKGQSVMIVETERERLLRDEEMVAALGFEPVGFERPDDAVAACRATPGRFDIILISYGLQTDGGLDLVRALREIAPSQPLLLAAASSAGIDVNSLADAGISEVLQRPLVSAELAQALMRCLRSPVALQM